MNQAVRKIYGKSKSVEGMRLGSQSIGGVWVDDAYVYRIGERSLSQPICTFRSPETS